jgi:uncharacterized protein
MAPTRANGKICYLEIPASDVQRSKEFYHATGEVSGAWVTNRPPAGAPGLLIYIMVDDVAATVDAVVAHGGAIVQPVGVDAPEITARFRDPGGNVIGLYQEPGTAKPSS